MGCNVLSTKSGPIIGCDTEAEARNHDPKRSLVDRAHDVTIEVGLGVNDTASSILLYIPDALRFVTGTDAKLGQRNSFSQFGKHMGWSWDDNLIRRTVDVMNIAGYGTLDLVLGHIPNDIVNEQLELGCKYFTPAPQTVREWARDLTMGFAILIPIARASNKKSPQVLPDAVSVSEKLAPKLVAREKVATPQLVISPTVIGLFQLLPWIKTFGKQIKVKWNTLREYLFSPNLTSIIKKVKAGDSMYEKILVELARNQPTLFKTAHILALADAAKVNINAAVALYKLARSRSELFTADHISALAEAAKANDTAAVVLVELASTRSEIFNEGHISVIAEIAKVNNYAADALHELAITRSDFFTADHISVIAEAAKVNNNAAWALFNLAGNRLDLSSQCIFALAEAAKANNAVGVLFDLARARPEIFNEGHITAIAEIAKVNYHAAGGLFDLAITRPEIFNEGHITAIAEVAKVNYHAEWALHELARNRLDLSSQCISALIEAAKVSNYATRALNNLVNLKRKRPDLFTTDHITAITEAVKANDTAEGAVTRHEVF